MPDYNEQLRQQVKERDGHRCQICGKREGQDQITLEVHHVDPRGMGGDDSKNVPENLLTLCPEHHRRIEGGIWSIYRFIPDEGGLIVMDAEGRQLQRDSLWFYRRHNVERVEALANTLNFANRSRHQLAWSVAKALHEIQEAKGWQHTGHSSLKELAKDFAGMSARESKKLARVYKWALGEGLINENEEGEMAGDIQNVDPELADVVRRMDDSELAQMASTLSPSDFWDEVDLRHQSNKKQFSRSFVVATGPVRLYRGKEPPLVNVGEKVIRGSLLTGGDDVSDVSDID